MFTWIFIRSGGQLDRIHDLREKTTIWKTWDTLTSLCRYKTIGTYLGQLCNSHARLDSERFASLVLADIDVICIQLFLVCNDPEQLRRLVHLKGDDAQLMLDLLQTVRDYLSPYS